jgi:gluconolactonase
MRLFALLLVLLPAAAQDFTGLMVERVSSGHRFTEGPAWSKDGYLLFSDIPANRILKLSPQGQEVFRENSGGANGNFIDEKGRLYTCEGGNRRVTRTGAKGAVEVLAERFEGKRLNAPNDITVRRDGHAYFTDPAFGKQADSRELDFYGVYHLTPKNEISTVWRGETRPNGIAVSPNGHILYVADSDARAVRAFDLDRQGNASGERILIKDIEGVPDGLKVDEKGNLYLAAKAVAIYTPEGKLIRLIEMPETPANLTFGDSDLQALYVTARTHVYKVKVPTKGLQP